MPKLIPSGLRALAVATCAALSLALSGAAAETDVVINEIMYHPPLDLDDLQFVELCNRGAASVDLSKWSFSKGITFVFPEKTKVEAGAYLVVCRNTTTFAENYGKDIAAVGNFSGHLSHGGEKLELVNASGRVIDSLRYSDEAPWPAGADGCSASLERICPAAPGVEPANWAASALPPFEKPAGTPGRRNDNFSATLPPVIAGVQFKPPPPGEKATVTAEVADSAGVKTVTLLWHTARPGSESPDAEVPMERVAGSDRQGTYRAVIEGQPAHTLVRFRIKAVSTSGVTRLDPAPNEPRPTHSYTTVVNTNTARIPFAYALNVTSPGRANTVQVWNGKSYHVSASPTRGNGAFIYVPPDGAEVLTFDHVRMRPRNGGFKVHFPKDHTFKGMTGINVTFEWSPRWVLAEPLAYELYRAAGNPACLTEHVRTWLDGRPLGYQLLIEQPNKAFLQRNQRDDSGYLYKATYLGQGLVGQYLKRTRPATGHEDLVAVHRGLTGSSGAAQWEFIQKHFNVPEFVNYYAVNLCIQNWDGYFNNHWLYHDSAQTGKWEVYPWDEDKTWGDYDGASPEYDWYTMPLTFGMNTDRQRAGGWPFGGDGPGGNWWRPPGWFSGPMLANPQFRTVFLARLKEICETVFTEEKLIPVIDAMEKRLEPEVALRAQLVRQNEKQSLDLLHSDVQSLRNQVKHRRKFILSELAKNPAPR